MAPSSPNRRTVNPLLSSFSNLSIDQLGPTTANRLKKSSNPSPLRGTKSSSSLRTTHQQQQHQQKSSHSSASSSSVTLSNSVHKALSRPINREDFLGRDLVRKDWGSSSSSATSPSKKSTSRKKATSVDRYITRDVDSAQLESHHPRETNNSGTATTATTTTTNGGGAGGAGTGGAQELSTALGIDLNRRILSFAADVPSSTRASREREEPITKEQRTKTANHSGTGLSNTASNPRRQVSAIPERVLDAPGLIDDYYLNLTDWSVDNILAIALGESLYLWNAQTGNVNQLSTLPEGVYYCSVKFSGDGHYLGLGTSEGAVHIYDIDESRLLRKMLGRECRVSSLTWSGTILSAGGLDGSIWNHDVQAARHKSSEMIGHRAEVCGLAWKPDHDDPLSVSNSGLLASGANDNIVNVWDARNPSTPRMTKNNHRAAVKAIAWCPWQANMLATGGGTSDKMVHFWNVNTSSRLQSLETRSQVTSIVFNPYAREFLTTHGLPDMHFSIHTFPGFQLVADIPKAHDTRILHSALSPDGCIVVTASSDENLKFWRVFENKRAKVMPNPVFGKAYPNPLSSKDTNQQDHHQHAFKGSYELR
ncbi:hypothetical protein MJO28_010475 [Puccinia striiformis f. sp. tritici]|uniref:CDC20/Fizzy WD40 domain-containing protein n=2 Tax=Puccinia striiformis f. sp. tritici TaxID=168172 RepID=A0A0L0UTX5_9BASI|nr:hypothetical protein Pst134EA_019288 [Puccinia striiformis f. sp. tritici]KAH9459133.1 hypothetical protein Pst134EA_019288 [Puccinia striiformis f. sp. tritici]KAI7944780.1 hypothetical protein MJO28_010475 [Puccinia striiformis f. sp. tritici]KAI9623510.1 hypothetical protein KEM48_009405 [Puccinia striiformis f. sp. tritici PST-130]KNE90473.1 hypothetical protein PSTG_16091 [Puccinia striiformis f. sp. tritici PST-78]